MENSERTEPTDDTNGKETNGNHHDETDFSNEVEPEAPNSAENEDEEEKESELPNPFTDSVDFKGEVIKISGKTGIIGYALEYIEPQNILIVGTKEGDILVYDPINFNLLATHSKVHQGWVISLKYNRETGLLFSTSSDRLIKVFKIENKNIVEVAKLEGHKDNVNCVLVLKDNQTMISCGRDPNLKVWDLTNYQLKTEIPTEEGGMGCSIVYIEELNWYGVSFFSSKIKFYDIETKECKLTLNTGSANYYINSLLYLPDRDSLIAQVSAKEVRIWERRDEEFVVMQYITSEGHANYVFVDKDETSMVLACDKPFLDVWDLDTLQRKTKIQFAQTPLKNSNGLVYLPKLQKIVVSAWNSPHLYVLEYKVYDLGF